MEQRKVCAEHVMNAVGKFAVMCRKEGIKQLGVVLHMRWLILNFVRLNFPSSNGSKSLNFCCPDWFYVLSWFFRWLTVLFSFLYTYYYPSAVYEFDFFLFNWIDGHSELYTLLLDKVHYQFLEFFLLGREAQINSYDIYMRTNLLELYRRNSGT
uniref:Uncharacterized protein n=1 Tax=Oryza nivara TaxID=4536 RepID=A0A0E0I8R3_ORYNI